jgi:hypothetical protein
VVERDGYAAFVGAGEPLGDVEADAAGAAADPFADPW